MARGGRERSESGMVSAELAVGLVTLLLVLSLVLGAVRVGMDRAAGISVASAIARETARDGDPGAVWSRARQDLPSGAGYAVSTSSGLVTVTVTLPMRAGALRAILPGGTQVTAVARAESP